MKLILYNTFSRKKEEFKPIRLNEVGMYVCGPTVYNFDHLGHARTYVFFDILKRVLIACGYQVKYVQNITDIGHLSADSDSGEDKLEKQAKLENKTPEEIALFYEKSHFEDMEKIGNLKPDFTPRASQYIPQIIEMTKILLDKGVAYTTNQGNVYFELAKYPEYGKFSNRKPEDMENAVRIEEEQDKRSSVDFALWKAASGSGMRTYDSPWSKGAPGWHIECSVMSRELLGQPFDIHGSAVEHVFPHHENEIAQSESAYESKLAYYWLHTGLLTLDGKKMSKSQGNSIFLKDVLKSKDPMILRLLLLSSHYRKPLNYREDLYSDWQKIWQEIIKVYTRQGKKDTNFYDRFLDILSDDLNIPGAINFLIQNLSIISFVDLERCLNLLGLKYISKEIPEETQRLLQLRDRARQDKDFTKADELRKKLESYGYLVEDTPDGSKITPKVK